MSERIVFCEKCRDDVAFTVNEEQLEGTIMGENYYYPGKQAFCVDCGSEIYVAEINDLNLKSLYNVFERRIKNIK